MYNLELHYLLAKITLLFLLAATVTGAMRLLRKPKGRYKPLRIAHITTGVLALLFFLLTSFLAPKIGGIKEVGSINGGGSKKSEPGCCGNRFDRWSPISNS